jgi:hypothetical protein
MHFCRVESVSYAERHICREARGASFFGRYDSVWPHYTVVILLPGQSPLRKIVTSKIVA